MDTIQVYKHTELKEKSRFYPKSMLSGEINTFEKLVLKDLDKINTNKTRYNMTKKEQEALKQLTEDPDIVIKPADKGGGIVILTTTQCEQEAQRFLEDETTYVRLKGDPTKGITEKYHEYIEKGYTLGILNEQERKYMKIIHPRLPVFYQLPKIHKNKETPPGRPIISGIESISSRVSEYVDRMLQPLVSKIPSHLKDTLNILQLLEEIKWEDNYIIAICDVRALYSNIPHTKGVQVIDKHLRESNEFLPEQIDYITEGIDLILRNNYFWFKDSYYIQPKRDSYGD